MIEKYIFLIALLCGVTIHSNNAIDILSLLSTWPATKQLDLFPISSYDAASLTIRIQNGNTLMPPIVIPKEGTAGNLAKKIADYLNGKIKRPVFTKHDITIAVNDLDATFSDKPSLVELCHFEKLKDLGMHHCKVYYFRPSERHRNSKNYLVFYCKNIEAIRRRIEAPYIIVQDCAPDHNSCDPDYADYASDY